MILTGHAKASILLLPVVNANQIKLSGPKILFDFSRALLSIELVFQFAFWLLLGWFSSFLFLRLFVFVASYSIHLHVMVRWERKAIIDFLLHLG